MISLRACVDQRSLTITIHNQTGLLDAPLKRLLARGVGLSNTIARLERLYGPDQKCVISNLEGGGVCASLSLPVRLMSPAVKAFEVHAVS